MRLIFKPAAEKELSDAIDWYEQCGQGLGAEFLRAFEATLAALSRNPFQFQKVEGETRRAALRRFPYAVYYLASSEKITVIACFHASRNPDRWRERAK